MDISAGGAFQKSDAGIYAEFEAAWSDGSAVLEPVGTDGTMAWVNAADIVGTRYHDNLSEDKFWSHHGNTKQKYEELVSQVPEIKEQLDQGVSMEKIRQDPRLAAAVSQYFDKTNAVKVYQYGDKYIFEGNGRHRVAIAQELGYDIPVRITHVVRRKMR